MYFNKKLKRQLTICFIGILIIISISYAFWYHNKTNITQTEILAAKILDNTKEDYTSLINDDEIILIVGNTEITYDKYSYILNKEKTKIDGGDNSYWNNDKPIFNKQETLMTTVENAKMSKEELEEQVLQTIKNSIALKQLQEEYNISITDEKVNEEYNKIIEYYGKESLEQLFKDNSLNETLYKELLKESLLEEELLKSMFRNEINNEQNLTSLSGYQRLLITFDDNNSELENLPKTSIHRLNETEAKIVIDNIYEELLNGASFNDMLDKYGEDNSFINHEIKYVKQNELLEPENTTLFDLKVNHFSQPILTNYGYVILYRYEPSKEYIENNIMDFATEEIWVRYRKIVLDKANNLNIEKTNLYVSAFANAFQ